MIRDTVIIDEEKRDGCGNCITDCTEGALHVIDKKARFVLGTLCDGLGACIGECPRTLRPLQPEIFMQII